MSVEARAELLKRVPHGFLGRRGGVSTGLYDSLNVALGSRDDRRAIVENRRIATEAVLPGGRLVTLAQVHSSDAVAVATPFEDAHRPDADALVTNRPGLALGIITADCAPILFADVTARVVGAAHAGWKGALGGVVDATVAKMELLGARRDRIVAAIGPCIARASYEVDSPIHRGFTEADLDNQRFFTSGRPGHYQFDLEAYVAHRLNRIGVSDVEALGFDTYAEEARFFSFRRATHRDEVDFGRQISIIGLS
ncbi:MAG: peptidoglycan editing factor PgeF [Sphingomonas sp.]